MPRYYSNTSYYDYLQYLYLPIHFYFFLVVVVFVLGFTWYINYESKIEDLMSQLRLILCAIPIVLLLVVHWLSSKDRRRVPFLISLPEERDSLHRAGGSPWGVAALLLFLLYMVSYQSKLRENWFPLLSKRWWSRKNTETNTWKDMIGPRVRLTKKMANIKLTTRSVQP